MRTADGGRRTADGGRRTDKKRQKIKKDIENILKNDMKNNKLILSRQGNEYKKYAWNDGQVTDYFFTRFDISKFLPSLPFLAHF